MTPNPASFADREIGREVARAGGMDSQRLETVITRYEAATESLRDLQQSAFWGAVWQVGFILADDALFFVRRSATIWAFDPIYIGAALIGIHGARNMIPLFMLGHIVINASVTAIIICFTILQSIFGYDEKEDIIVMFTIRLPLLFAVACAVPSYRLFKAVHAFREAGQAADPRASLLESGPGSEAPDGATPALVAAQLAGAAGLARARADAGLERQPSDELPGVSPEFLCPILGTVMTDPVMTQASNTYDRSSIERWLRDHNTDPLTNIVMSDLTLRENRNLRGLIESWRSQHRGQAASV